MRTLCMLLLAVLPVWAQETVMDDDFNNNTNNWYTGRTGEYDYSVQNGVYRMEAFGGSEWSLFKDVGLYTWDNFSFEAVLTKRSGVNNYAYGLLWGYQDTDNKYVYGISGDGHFMYGKFDGGTWKLIKEWTKTDNVNQNDARNVLRIARVGSTLKLYINDAEVYSGPWETPKASKVGFLFRNPMVVEVDRITVQRITSFSTASKSRQLASGDVSAYLSKTITNQLSGDYVRCGAISPDGQLFALGAGTSTLKIFNTNDGSFVKSLTGHTSWMNGLAWSYDGTKIASASSDNTIRIWSVSGGYTTQTISNTFTDHTLCVAFSPDGRYVAAGGYETVVKVYDVNSGSLVRTLYGLKGNVWSVRFTDDGRSLVGGDASGNLQVWETSSWSATKTAYHSGTISHITFTADGTKMITSSAGSNAKIWSWPSLKEVNTLTHSDKVWSSAVIPGDRFVATASWDKSVKIWDMASGTAKQTLSGHTGNVCIVLASSDGTRLISAGDDNTIRVWNLSGASGGQLAQGGGPFDVTLNKTVSYELSGDYNRGGAINSDGSKFAIGGKDGLLKVFSSSGSLLHTLRGHSSWVNAVSFSGRDILASGCSDKSIRIWNTATGSLTRTINTAGDIIAMAISADGRWVAGGGFGKDVTVYDANTGSLIRALSGHTGSIWGMQFSPDGRYLLSGDGDGNIKVWNTSSWSLERTAFQSGWVTHFEFTKDGQKVVSTSYGNTVKVWSFPSMSELRSMSHTSNVWMAALSPDDKYIFSGGADNVVRVWELATGSSVKTLSGHTKNVGVVLASSDGRQLVSASDDNTIKLWNVSGVGQQAALGTVLSSLGGGAFDVSLQKTVSYELSGEYNRGGAMNADGSKFAIGGKGGLLKVFSSTGTMLRSLTGHTSWVNGLSFYGNDLLASGCSDKTVRIWNVSSGTLLRTIQTSNDVISVAYSPDGRYVAAGDFGQLVTVYDANTGALVRTLYGHTGTIWGMKFSPDGRYLASGDANGNIKIWSTSSWTVEKTAFQSGWITHFAFSKDGQKVVSTSYGNTVKVWNFPSMVEARSMSHTDHVWMATLSADNKYVFSSGADNMIRVWDMESGSSVKNVSGHTKNVAIVLLSPDGKNLVSASDDNTIKLWTVSGIGAGGGVVYEQQGGGGKILKVAKDGSGQYSSISAAITAAGSGDEIKIKAGTYYESNLSVTKSNVRLTGDGASSTIVDGGGQSKILEVRDTKGVVISGLTFKNSTGSAGAIQFNKADVTFTNNVVRDNQNYGIYIWSNKPVITNNVFYNNCGGQYAKEEDAIALNGSSPVIKNNIFYNNNGGSAIDNEGSAYPTITFNIIYNSGQAFKRCYGGEGNLFVDPVLNTSDFTVRSGSPAMGAGEYGSTIGLITTGGGTKIESLAAVDATLTKTIYGHTDKVRAVAFSPSGTLASGGGGGEIILWDASGNKIRSITGHTSWVNGLAFSPSGNTLASASSDKNAMVWNVSGGYEMQKMTGHTDLVVPVQYSPNGRTIATGSFDQSVKIWDASSGTLVSTLSGHKSSLWGMAFSGDGNLLATGDTDGEIRLWNATTWTFVRKMNTSTDTWINGLAFSSDGKYLYAGQYDNQITVWDVATGVLVRTLFGHSDHVWTLALSPDGKVLASGSADKTVKLWDLTTYKLIKTLSGPTEEVFSVSFSNDGTKLAASSDDKNVYLYTVKGVSGKKTEVIVEEVKALPPYLTSTAQFADADGDRLLKAGESGKVTLTVRNTGKGPAQGVTAKFSVTQGSLGMFLGSPTVYIGEILPGGEKTVSTNVDASEDVLTQTVSVKAEATEKNGFGADAIVINLNTRASDPPLLSMSKYVLRDDGSGQSQGNGDGVIQKKETIEMTVFVRNGGQGTASDVKLVLKSSDPGVMISQGTVTLGELLPSGEKKGVLVFAVSGNYSPLSPRLPLTLEVTEKRSKFNKFEDLGLNLDQSYRKEVVVDAGSNFRQDLNVNIKDRVDKAVSDMNTVISKTAGSYADLELPERDNVYAVIIGISDYKSKDVPALPYAINDASSMYALLTNNITGGIPKSNIKFLAGPDATLTEIKVSLGWLVNQGMDDESAVLIFYYSGHGAPEQDDQGNVRTAYLIPYDGQPKFLAETGIGVDYLQQELGKVKAKNVFVAMDACFTGSGRSFMKQGARGINLVPKEILKDAGEGKVFMTAAANDQSAFDDPENKHGLFTTFLLEALSGKGDGDDEIGNNDGWVTSNEVFGYLKDRVVRGARKLENVKQEPQMIGSGQVRLTRTFQKKAGSMTFQDKKTKLSKAFNAGSINMDQYAKALNEIKLNSESQTLKDFLGGKIDAVKFGQSY